MRRLPAPRRVRRCRAGIGWCAWPAPLPVQGTPRAVFAPAPPPRPSPQRSPGMPARGVPRRFPRILPVG